MVQPIGHDPLKPQNDEQLPEEALRETFLTKATVTADKPYVNAADKPIPKGQEVAVFVRTDEYAQKHGLSKVFARTPEELKAAITNHRDSQIIRGKEQRFEALVEADKALNFSGGPGGK